MDETAVPTLLAGATAALGDQSLLTYYDDATGERFGLSAVELAGWAARTARLLTEECGLGPGSRAAILLPAHWQTAGVLLGAWSAGLSVSFRLAATAGLPALGPGQDEPLDATFVARPRLDDWLDHVPDAHHRFVLGLAPGAAALDEVPTGYRDYITDMRRYADTTGTMPAYTMVRGTDAASVDGTSYQDWGKLAREIAAMRNLREGDRILIDGTEHEHPLKWLLAPLSVGASVVLCTNLDPAKVSSRVAAEQVTRVF